jgi:hypothetical protein
MSRSYPKNVSPKPIGIFTLRFLASFAVIF